MISEPDAELFLCADKMHIFNFPHRVRNGVEKIYIIKIYETAWGTHISKSFSPDFAQNSKLWSYCSFFLWIWLWSWKFQLNIFLLRQFFFSLIWNYHIQIVHEFYKYCINLIIYSIYKESLNKLDFNPF